MRKYASMSGQAFQHMLMSRTKNHVFDTITKYHDGIAIVDQFGVIVFVNPACERIFGRKASFLVGEPFGFPLDTGKIIEANMHSGREARKIEFIVTETQWMGKMAYMVLTRDVTSHQSTLAELRRFRRALDGTLEMIALLDPLTLTIMYVNQGCVNTLGYSRKEMLGKKPNEFIQRSYRYIRKLLLPLITGHKKIAFFNTDMAAKDGHYVEVEFVVQVVQQGDDSPVMIVIARDITERRRVQAEIAKLYQAVEQSPCAVVITDVKGNIEYVNPKFQAITGYRMSEVFGKNPRILKSGNQPTAFYEELWRTISSGDEWRGEFYNKRKNGECFWEAASISPVRSHDGKITHYIAVKEDVTERKIAQEELMKAHAVLNHIFEATGEGLVVIDKDYNIIRANTELAKLYNTPQDALPGEKCYNLLHNSACFTTQCPLKQIMAGVQRVEVDNEKVWPDGRAVYCITTATPFRAPDGKVIGVLENVKDITERRKEQDKLKKELRLAAKLQHEFLPQNIEQAGFKLKSIYFPYHHVSGDGFDYLYNSDRQVLTGVLFDVMGHGFSAALQTSALRVLFKQVATKRMSLSKKMSWLNKHATEFMADSFAAAIGFEVNFRSKKVTYCAAGINYFYRLSHHEFEVIKVPGPFLGVADDAVFEHHILPFGDGDSFYFLSDGLTDLLRLQECHATSFDEVYAMLLNMARGGGCRDDATAVCIGVREFG